MSDYENVVKSSSGIQEDNENATRIRRRIISLYNELLQSYARRMRRLDKNAAENKEKTETYLKVTNFLLDTPLPTLRQ